MLFPCTHKQPHKKDVKIFKGLYKAASALVVQMRTEKIGLKKHSRNVPGFDTPEQPCIRGRQSAKHVLIECRAYTGRRNRTWGEDRGKAAFGRISWPSQNLQRKLRNSWSRLDLSTNSSPYTWLTTYMLLATNTTAYIVLGKGGRRRHWRGKGPLCIISGIDL